METVEEYYSGLPEQTPGLKALGSQILSLSKMFAILMGHDAPKPMTNVDEFASTP